MKLQTQYSLFFKTCKVKWKLIKSHIFYLEDKNISPRLSYIFNAPYNMFQHYCTFLVCMQFPSFAAFPPWHSEYSIKIQPLLHKKYCWKVFDFHLCLPCRDAEIPPHWTWKRAGTALFKSLIFLCLSSQFRLRAACASP